MDSAQFIKLLTETEHSLLRRKQNALVRGSWTKVIEIEAQYALCGQLREAVTKEANSLSEAVERAIASIPK